MKHISIIFFLLLSFQVFAQNRAETGIVYGKNHAFAITAPKGWVLDNQSGVSQGLHAVFYREGQSWSEGEVGMYASTTSLTEGPDTTIQQFIQSDLQNFQNQYPDLETTDSPGIRTKDSSTAIVKHFTSKTYKQHEAVAYIQSGGVGVLLVLTSRTKEGFLSSLAAFQELVESYYFLSSNLIIDKQ